MNLIEDPMNIAVTTRQKCPDLANFLEDCCRSPLLFEGDNPLRHSSHNHIHLWALEFWADHHSWIDLEYRSEFVDHIFKHWRMRLKGMVPYRDRGYRLYLYEDIAPTISVVAETSVGFPYSGQPTFVERRSEIMELYLKRSWTSHFIFESFDVDPKKILSQIEKTSGSIGKPTANALGIKVGALRTLIEQMGLQSAVNDIRKKFRRRPARFSYDEELHVYRIHEQRVEPGFA